MKWLVPSEQKLVAFLQSQLGSYSGKFLRKMLEANLCRINGHIERFGSRVISRGDAVELAPSWKSLLTPKLSSCKTILENEDFLIVCKPSGWICTDEEAKKTFGPNHFLVHRLDKGTTGLLIIAKGRANRDLLMELFEKREIKKRYIALVDGVPSEKEGTRKSLFAKKGSFQGQTIWGSSDKGLTAITHWELIAKGKNVSLIACEPFTGRTHQIRIHMAEMGHPIITDRQYAKTYRSTIFASRPLLHSYQLQFSFKGEGIDVQSEPPQDMIDIAKLAGINLKN